MDALSSKLVERDGRAFEIRMVREGAKVKEMTYELYRKRDGNIFALPVNDADTSPGLGAQSLISRDCSTNLGARNMFLIRPGWRYATLADVKAQQEQSEKNAANQAETTRLRHPVEQAKMIAEIQGRVMAQAINDARTAVASPAQASKR